MSSHLYHIIPLSKTELLVVAVTWQRPDMFLDDLAIELKKKPLVTSVIFDFLIKNGTKDRFYKSFFDPQKIRFASFERFEADSKVASLANEFFSENINLLEESNLTRAQKYMFKKELAI